jgi:hypothetical protein
MFPKEFECNGKMVKQTKGNRYKACIRHLPQKNIIITNFLDIVHSPNLIENMAFCRLDSVSIIR